MKTSAHLANALGHGIADKRIDILRLIDQTGSISQAAREANVSYKAAWQAIDTLTNLSGVSLVEKLVGGAGGGGAHLTEAGRQLLTTASLLEKIRHEALQQLQAGNTDIHSSTLSQLTIRTSMRNHLPCQVKKIEEHGQIVRVFLSLTGGELLVARITRASAELLSFKINQPVLALFKATAVEVGLPSDFGKDQGKNLLMCKADRISPGETGNEISVVSSAGLHLVGFAPTNLAIALNSPVVAAIDEAAIVIALTE